MTEIWHLETEIKTQIQQGKQITTVKTIKEQRIWFSIFFQKSRIQKKKDKKQKTMRCW